MFLLLSVDAKTAADAGLQEVSGSRIEQASDLPVEQRPAIKTWVDRRKISLGETLTLNVRIRHRAGQKFRLPQDVSFGKMELLGKSLETYREEGGWENDHYAFRLIALEPGHMEIEPVRFGGMTKSGDVVYLESRRIAVSVNDPAGGQVDPKIKETAAVVKVLEKNYILIYFFAVMGGAFFMISMVWYVARNWERWHPKAPTPPPPPRPPEEVAFEKLKALRSNPPMDLESKKNWYIDLSEVIREYLANRFDFDALESTTEEIIEAMKTRKTVGVTQAEMWKFMIGCDMVKFAKYISSGEEDREMIEEAFRIVEATTPGGEEKDSAARA